MDSAKQALLLGAGLFLTIALITLMVTIFGTASNAGKAAQNEFTGLQTELAEQTFLVYDGTVVTGSQVLSALNKFDGHTEFGVMVQTGLSTAWYYANASNPNSLTAATASTINTKIQGSTYYINPSGKFNATIVRDSNDVIKAIKFVQQ
ncbi:ABC transporter permease [Bacillus salitolerans]|uniref:ABC transporter permease n=1 Tax=Bacillus salitolerans TaxID=1437434 RepID=A0ABW4LMT1_9BACI